MTEATNQRQEKLVEFIDSIILKEDSSIIVYLIKGINDPNSETHIDKEGRWMYVDDNEYINAFNLLVNRYIKEGYKPVGGISLDNNGNFYQTIIKKYIEIGNIEILSPDTASQRDTTFNDAELNAEEKRIEERTATIRRKEDELINTEVFVGGKKTRHKQVKISKKKKYTRKLVKRRTRRRHST